ncbi:Kinesin light chain 3-like protein [Drosera capensis]
MNNSSFIFVLCATKQLCSSNPPPPMPLRQATAALLKRIRSTYRFSSAAAASRRRIPDALAGQTYSREKYCFSSRKGGNFLWILISGHAALILGSGSSVVLAEDVATEVTSAGNIGGSNVTGLQRIEEGSVVSNEHTSKWRIFTDNGRDFFMQGKMDEAEKFFLSAIEEAKEGFGEKDPHVASAYNNLAELYRVRKEYDKAEPLYRSAVKILEESFGPEDVRVGAALHNLGKFYIMQRKLEEARVSYEIKGRVLGHGHPDYADTMYHLGTVLNLQGNVNDAQALILDSVRILEEGGLGESNICIRRLGYLAHMFLKSNQPEERENVQRKILHIMELTKSWSSPETVIAAESLATTLQSVGKLSDAQDLLERCLEAQRSLLPEGHVQLGAKMLRLARLTMLKANQERKFGNSEAVSELDKGKDLLQNTIRIAQQRLDGLAKQKRKFFSFGRRQDNDKDARTALLILLQSLNELSRLEIIKGEFQESKGTTPVLEAEAALQRCISAYKEFVNGGLISASSETQSEYLSCLKHLLNMMNNQKRKTDEFQRGTMDKLKDEIKHVESEIAPSQ